MRCLESQAHVAGLAATAWPVLPHRGPGLFQRILQGWLVASLALAWAFIMVLMLRLVVRHLSRVDVVPVNLHTARAAVWYAPAILLPLSVTGVTAAVVLVIGATRLLCAQSETGGDMGHTAGVAVLGAGELSLELLPRHLAPALAVSAGLQGSVVLMLLGHAVSAAGLLFVERGHAYIHRDRAWGMGGKPPAQPAAFGARPVPHIPFGHDGRPIPGRR